jgi:hypothetical protein
MTRASAAAIAVAFVALAGCGGGSSSSSTTTSGGGTASSAPRTQPANPPPSTVTTNPKPAPSSTHQQTLSRIPLPPDGVAQSVLEGRPTDLACGSLVTPAYLRKAYGTESACKAAFRTGGFARSVRIVSVRKRGDRAVVIALPTGGPSSGERLTVTLLNGPTGWQVVSLHSNVKVGP